MGGADGLGPVGAPPIGGVSLKAAASHSRPPSLIDGRPGRS